MNTKELVQDTTKRAIQKYHDLYTKNILSRLTTDEANIAKNSEDIETLDELVADALNEHQEKITTLENKVANLSTLTDPEMDYILDE